VTPAGTVQVCSASVQPNVAVLGAAAAGPARSAGAVPVTSTARSHRRRSSAARAFPLTSSSFPGGPGPARASPRRATRCP
jgi:hypothetical protein